MKYFKVLFFTSVLCLWVKLPLAQINAPSAFPYRVVLNLTENPYTSVAVTWRTDVTVTEGFCELQPAPQGPVRKEDSKTFKARTTTVKYEYGDEPDINANQHSLVLSDLVPSKKYIYRVGCGEYWSEWFEYQSPSADDSRFSFVYFGDPQNDLKSQWSRVIRKAYRHTPDCGFMFYCGDETLDNRN